MMRKINFRVYYNDKRGSESGFLGNCYGFEYFFKEKMFTLDFFLNKEPVFYVQQFTGLFDITGQPIYEGDIIKYNTLNNKNKVIDEVVYLKTAFCVKSEEFAIDEYEDSIEVIGNIFENKELLEK